MFGLVKWGGPATASHHLLLELLRTRPALLLRSCYRRRPRSNLASRRLLCAARFAKKPSQPRLLKPSLHPRDRSAPPPIPALIKTFGTTAHRYLGRSGQQTGHHHPMLVLPDDHPAHEPAPRQRSTCLGSMRSLPSMTMAQSIARSSSPRRSRRPPLCPRSRRGGARGPPSANPAMMWRGVEVRRRRSIDLAPRRVDPPQLEIPHWPTAELH